MAELVKPGDPILVVDFGSAAVKIAEATRTEAGLAILRIAHKCVAGVDFSSSEAMGGLLKTMIVDAGMTARRVILVLNGNAVAVFHRDFPRMPAESLEKTIRFELKKEIKYNLDEAALSWRILKEFDAAADDGKVEHRIRVMYAVADGTAIAKFSEICRVAELAPAAFVAASLELPALAGKLGILEGLGPEEIALFLDFGNSQMTADFVSDGGLRFSKTITMGGSALTEVVRAMSTSKSPLSVLDAETLKFRIGLKTQGEIDQLDPTDPEANLHKVLSVSFKKLFQRVRLSTGYFFANFKDTTLTSQFMKRIAGLGGNFEIPGVSDQFAEAYDAQVVRLDPWSAIDASACDPAQLRRHALSFTPIVAALAGALSETGPVADFLALDTERRRPKTGFRVQVEELITRLPVYEKIARLGFSRALAGIAALWLASGLALAGYAGWNAWSLSTERAELTRRIEAFDAPGERARRQSATDAFEIFQRKMEAKAALEFPRFGFDRLLLALSAALPDGDPKPAAGGAAAPGSVTLTSLAFSADETPNAGPPTLSFTGVATVYDRLLKFNERLAKTPGFEKVTVRRTEQVDERIEFQYDCALAVPQGSAAAGAAKGDAK